MKETLNSYISFTLKFPGVRSEDSVFKAMDKIEKEVKSLFHSDEFKTKVMTLDRFTKDYYQAIEIRDHGIVEEEDDDLCGMIEFYSEPDFTRYQIEALKDIVTRSVSSTPKCQLKKAVITRSFKVTEKEIVEMESKTTPKMKN